MPRNKLARLECKDTEYYTPKHVVAAAHELFGGIELDAATHESNPTGARRFYFERGLELPWVDETWVNPPYGEHFESWTYKCHAEAEQGHRIAALYPCGARFSTKYFQAHVLNKFLTCWVVFDKRLEFTYIDGTKVGANNIYDSCLYCYNVEPFEVYRSFRHLGKVVKMEVYS